MHLSKYYVKCFSILHSNKITIIVVDDDEWGVSVYLTLQSFMYIVLIISTNYNNRDL